MLIFNHNLGLIVWQRAVVLSKLRCFLIEAILKRYFGLVLALASYLLSARLWDADLTVYLLVAIL